MPTRQLHHCEKEFKTLEQLKEGIMNEFPDKFIANTDFNGRQSSKIRDEDPNSMYVNCKRIGMMLWVGSKLEDLSEDEQEEEAIAW